MACSQDNNDDDDMGQKQFKHSKPPTDAAPLDPRLHTPLEDIERHHATLYKTFRAGTCRPLAYRRQQLYALARMCQENADALADAVYKDLGKPKLEFFAFEVGAVIQRALLCAERLEEWAQPEKCKNLPDWQQPWNPTVYRCPKGPVLIISPWNYPLILSLQAVYAAISAGCPAVLKPSEYVPNFAALLADLFPKYLDQNAYVVVNGAVPEATKLLELRWAQIFYTGNGKVGRVIAAAAAKHLTPVSLELGGKSPVYVDAETTDLKVAARRILYGKCANAGQTCIAPDYVLVLKSKQEELVSAMKEVIVERYPQGALASDSYGRVVNAAHFERLRELLARSKGRLAIQGEVDPERLKIAPTVLTDVPGDDSLMEEELFGPILPIVPVENLDEAINYINDHDHPLAFYAFTESQEVKDRLMAETLSGSLIFNDTFDQLAVDEMPFSGVGESGYGMQVVKYGFDGFTHFRSSEDVPLAMEMHLGNRYPPYTPEKLEFMSAAVRLLIPSS
ncbi:aldehyde dehydrogenase [Fomitiporia mediterranea MF3/22]|uniref:aldehyde dehydrogenase n=1 Tax=Fomitiporia mediterranea (strain MF3/22) TaxID=694068 RepID=UPI0004407505|nr:aldehyde dehydrogenase [Fomitiporia mediterranea MF3/22]EJD05268.1 aldehyde dehydrogenase [Fomitiporia mediterranea MF3/22]